MGREPPDDHNIPEEYIGTVLPINNNPEKWNVSSQQLADYWIERDQQIVRTLMLIFR